MYYKSKLNVIFFPDETFTTFMMIYKNYHYFNSRKAAAYMYKIYYLFLNILQLQKLPTFTCTL